LGKVAVTFKVMPEGVDVDLESILEKAKDLLGERFHTSSEDPIAFGLKALKIVALFDDAEGMPEDVEKSLSSIDGVQSVEILELTLV